MELQRLLTTIEALEAQRHVLGDSVTAAALAPLHAQLAALKAGAIDAAREQTLRQVSILFLDVVGSTALSQRLDPEEVHAVMDGALSRCTAVVQLHRGKVLQYAGDNLLAVFGGEYSDERDAESAVLCGLALLEVGRTLGHEVKATHAQAGFGVRVGVHTGAVLLGGGVDGEGTIRGMAVNIAARMEHTAPPGGLRISQDTWHQVRGMFEVEVQPPMQVKGVEAPVRSVLVLRAKPRAFRIAARGIEGVATRMIGRRNELQCLQSAFDGLRREPGLSMFTVVAEAGVGKSRLLYEFQVWSEAHPQPFLLFRGRAHPHSQGQPYGLLRDLLAWRFEITDDDSNLAARLRLESALMPLFEPDDGPDMAQGHAHLLAHLVGFDASDSRHVSAIAGDPRQIRNRAFHTVAQMFRRLSVRDGHPVVLELEDLHWADDASLDLLELLAELNADVPMLVLALARPTLFERRNEWPRRCRHHQRIDLAPLDDRHSYELAHELLQRLPEVPPTLRAQLVGGADGNPFYMEELVRMLIDQGAIETGEERWTLHVGRLLAAHVPPTLTGLLQARLDGLPPLERRALQEASVIGAVFWDQALRALDERAEECLPPLVQRELVLPRTGSVLEGLREYGFRHHLLHQVTYDSVFKRHKRALHGRLAHWLSAQSGTRVGDHLGLTADHYERAGDAANAAAFHAQAALHARDRYAPEVALVHVQRALALLDTLGSASHSALSWQLNETGEIAFGTLGRRTEQRACLAAMQALADEADDDARRVIVAHREAFLYMRLADYAMEEAAARRGIALAERLQDGESHARALRNLARALANQGRRDEAKTLCRQGLAAAQAGGWRHVEAQFYNTLYGIAADEGDLVGALRMNEADLQICQELGDRLAEAVIYCNIGESWLELGDLPKAQQWLDESLQRLRAVGERTIESAALSDLSQLGLLLGHAPLARQRAQTALELAQAVQAPDYETRALLRLGEAELALSQPQAAAAAFERAASLASAGSLPYWSEAAAGALLTALEMGDLSLAEHHAHSLRAHWLAQNRFEGSLRPRWVMAVLHRFLVETGDPESTRLLEQAHAELQRLATSVAEIGLREAFLERLPEHRALVDAWARQQANKA